MTVGGRDIKTEIVKRMKAATCIGWTRYLEIVRRLVTVLMYTKHDPRVTNTVIRYCIGAIDVVDLIFRYQCPVETFILSTSPRAEQI